MLSLFIRIRSRYFNQNPVRVLRLRGASREPSGIRWGEQRTFDPELAAKDYSFRAA